MITPAPKRGLVSDAPTGRLNFDSLGPSDGLRDRSWSVRTSFSVPTGLRFFPTSRGSRSARSNTNPNGEPTRYSHDDCVSRLHSADDRLGRAEKAMGEEMLKEAIRALRGER